LAGDPQLWARAFWGLTR